MSARIPAVLVLVLAVGTAHAAEFPCWGLLTGDHVRVRSGPSRNHRDMGKVEKGMLVRVLGISRDGRWFRVEPPPGMDVWIFAKFVSVQGPRGVLIGNNVNVRVRPELTGEVVIQLKKGATVRVKERRGDWLRITPPARSLAYISTQYVRPMTDAQLAAYRAEQARKRAEAERRRREEERRRAERARKRREKILFDTADRLLAVELAKDARSRSWAAARAAFEDAHKRVTTPALRSKIAAKLAVVREMQRLQAALAKEAAPGPLARFDFAAASRRFGMAREVGELLRLHRLAKKAHRDRQRRLARRRGHQVERDGWVSYLGPGLRSTGATHRLVKNGKVLALVRSDGVELDAFLGTHVRVAGRLAAKQPAPIVEITRLTVVCE